MLKAFSLSVALGLAAICATASLAGAETRPAKAEAAKPKAAKSKVAKSKPAGYCKTMTGKMVGWGVDSVRVQAEKALDSEIAAWEHRSSFTAAPKDRKTDCKIYIEFLNEYECTARAVVCR